MRYALSKHIVTVLLASMLGAGCINIKSLPSYARSGDIVSIGMAGIKLNTDGMVTIMPEDVTATITDAGANVYNVKVLRTFRAFPDNTSFYIAGSLDRTENPFYSQMEPFDGQWWVTLHLVNPLDDTPLPLAVGDATLELTVAELTDTFDSDGTLDEFSIEIIAGVVNKEPTDSDFYLYGAYAPQQSLTVQPDSLAGISRVGGLQLKLDYDPAALPPGATIVPHLVPILHDPHINIVQRIADNGDGTYALIAMITNPAGFVPDSTPASGWVIGSSTFKDLNFAVLTDDASLVDYATNYSIDTANSFYIDENGDKLLTVNPVLGLNF